MVRSVAIRLQSSRAMRRAFARSRGHTRAHGGLGWSSVTVAMVATVATLALSALGCVERDPFSAGDVAAADAFHASHLASATSGVPADGAGAAGSATERRVACACDAEGGLHVQAPADATVRAAESSEDAQATITLPAAEARGTRLRHTVSLGFAGDGKLTDIPSSRHAAWGDEGSARGGTYVRYGYGGVGRAHGWGRSSAGVRSRGASRSANSGGSQAPRGGGLIFSPLVHRTMAAGGTHGRGSGGSGGGSRGPR